MNTSELERSIKKIFDKIAPNYYLSTTKKRNIIKDIWDIGESEVFLSKTKKLRLVLDIEQKRLKYYVSDLRKRE